MLTKDLIRLKRRGEKFYPQFVDVTQASHQQLARQLLQSANVAKGQTLATWQAAVKALGLEQEAKLVKGLQKVLADACTAETEGKDVEATRWLLLETAQTIRSTGQLFDAPSFLQRVADEVGMTPEGVRAALYADLPELQTIETVPQWKEAELLSAYNMALLKALLFRAETLKVSFAKVTLPEIRRFGRALKFHKVLATGQMDEKKVWHFEISGPLRPHMEQAQVYGLHFVRLLPALARMPKFDVELTFEWNNTSATFPFSEKLLKEWMPPNESAAGYYPEDLDTATDSLQKVFGTTYSIKPGAELLTFPDGTTCFPDWTVTQETTGKMLHIELFHRWHDDALRKRLEALALSRKDFNLVVGACKSLTKQKGVARWLESNTSWTQRGFSFRDSPTAEQLLESLTRAFSS